MARTDLGGAQLPPSRCKADVRFGPDLIIELVHKYPHEITLIPVGPESNIALAVLKDPSIVPLVKRVVLMGGSISGGNVNGAAEFNVLCDPEAADIVFNAGWPITMVGLDVTEITLMSNADVAELGKKCRGTSEIRRRGRALSNWTLSRNRIQRGRHSRRTRSRRRNRSLIPENQSDARGCGNRRPIRSRRNDRKPQRHGGQSDSGGRSL